MPKQLESAIGIETFDDVFDAISDTPAEAANMTARAELLSAVKTQVETWKLPQGVAAKHLGTTRPRLNDLLQRKLEKFSLDALVNLAAASGVVLEMKFAADI